MKRYIVTATLAALVSAGFVSCNLDRDPTTHVPQDKSSEDYAAAVNWDRGIMARFRARGGNVDITSDVQADELNATADYGNNYGGPHGWVDLLASSYEPRDTYLGIYSIYKDLNTAIAQLPTLRDRLTDTQQKANVDRFIGRSHFIRAYLYLELALRYGKAYDPATAATELSVPLILEYNIKARPARSTNAQVYGQIVADLDKAQELLSGSAGEANAREITIDAVTALQARVALYMQDWQKAYQYASRLTQSSTYELMAPTTDAMLSYWRSDGVGLKETILQPYASWPDETADVPGLYLYPRADSHTFRPYFVPTQGLIDLYPAGDTRRAAYFSNQYTVNLGGLNINNIYIATKFWGNPSRAATRDAVWGVIPDYRMEPKVIRLAEMYLIAAEAAYKIGGDALTPLNALRVSRGLTALSGVTGSALETEIRQERQRELFLEGFRLFDLKRWGLPMNRMQNQVAPDGTVAFLAVNVYTLQIPANHDKFVWPIPYRDIQTNKNLKQNPGY